MLIKIKKEYVVSVYIKKREVFFDEYAVEAKSQEEAIEKAKEKVLEDLEFMITEFKFGTSKE